MNLQHTATTSKGYFVIRKPVLNANFKDLLYTYRDLTQILNVNLNKYEFQVKNPPTQQKFINLNKY